MKNKGLRSALMVMVWLLIWQGVDMLIDSKLIMAGPCGTIIAFGKLLCTRDFYRVVIISTIRIMTGFLIAFCFAILLSVLSYRFVLLREFLQPAVLFMKSIPVASFVIMALLWIGSRRLSVLIVFLIVFPILYTQLLTGLLGTDKKLLEMAEVFRYSLKRRIQSIFIPAIFDGVKSSCRLAVGMSFKAGIAAEVIAQPVHSIGEKLYLAKLYYITGELFAWTLIIVLLSAVMEWITVKILELGYKNICKDIHYSPENVSCQEMIEGYSCVEQIRDNCILIRGLRKVYGERTILNKINLNIPLGARLAVVGESGIGKTTFLRILAGLEEAEFEDKHNLPEKKVMVFQDSRLIEHNNAISNVVFSMSSKKSHCFNVFLASKALEELMTVQEMLLPVCKMSGGMRKRVELTRALLADGDLILLDEPFTGLDEDNRRKVIAFMNRFQAGRTVVISAHSETEAVESGAEMLLYLRNDGFEVKKCGKM